MSTANVTDEIPQMLPMKKQKIIGRIQQNAVYSIDFL